MNIAHRISTAAAIAALALACSSSTSDTSSGGSDGGVKVKGPIGAPCPGGSSDCADGLLCAAEDPGGGQCYKICAPSTDADCGDTTKYACSSEGHCYLRCAGPADCKRQGYVCKDDKPARPPIKFCDVP